jgi:hypothetical protein
LIFRFPSFSDMFLSVSYASIRVIKITT